MQVRDELFLKKRISFIPIKLIGECGWDLQPKRFANLSPQSNLILLQSCRPPHCKGSFYPSHLRVGKRRTQVHRGVAGLCWTLLPRLSRSFLGQVTMGEVGEGPRGVKGTM